MQNDDYWATSFFAPDRFRDVPGVWKVEVSIDGQVVGRTQLRVQAVAIPEKRLAFLVEFPNFNRTDRLGGGSYVRLGAQFEVLQNNYLGVGIAGQIFPNIVQDELATVSYTRFLWGQNTLYGSVSFQYANTLRKPNRGAIGFELTPFDSWDSNDVGVATLPLAVYYDLDSGQWICSFEVLRLRFKI